MNKIGEFTEWVALLELWYPKRQWLAVLLADQLKAYRELKGLTREQTAEEFSNILNKEEGIDARTILRWESGKQAPHLQTYLKLRYLFVEAGVAGSTSLPKLVTEASDWEDQYMLDEHMAMHSRDPWYLKLLSAKYPRRALKYH